MTMSHDRARRPSPLRHTLALIAAAAIAACGGGKQENPTAVADAQVGTPAAANKTPTAPAAAPASAPANTAGTPTDSGATVASAPGAVDFIRSMIPARAAGVSQEQITVTGQFGVPSDIGAFRISCDFSHMANDDPIVFPNQPGRSHLHTFFGNTGTDAFSTADSIATTGNSTCRGGTANRSAYWVPSMIDTKTGAPVRPADAMIYYKTGYNGISPAQV
ncbi:MAG: DUF1996 domain-containing protein, partial [Rhizobacter sp.]